MKKLLITLLLGAGLVTVASADQHNCLNADTNKCCIDVVNAQNAIDQSRGAGIAVQGGYNVVYLNVDFINDATGPDEARICKTKAFAVKDGHAAAGVVGWYPTYWNQTAEFTATSSSAR